MKTLESKEEIENMIRSLAEKEEEIRKEKKALQVQKNALIREEEYGPRRKVGLELPISDDEWIEKEMKISGEFKYEVLHKAIALLRKEREESRG